MGCLKRKLPELGCSTLLQVQVIGLGREKGWGQDAPTLIQPPTCPLISGTELPFLSPQVLGSPGFLPYCTVPFSVVFCPVASGPRQRDRNLESTFDPPHSPQLPGGQCLHSLEAGPWGLLSSVLIKNELILNKLVQGKQPGSLYRTKKEDTAPTPSPAHPHHTNYCQWCHVDSSDTCVCIYKHLCIGSCTFLKKESCRM